MKRITRVSKSSAEKIIENLRRLENFFDKI